MEGQSLQMTQIRGRGNTFVLGRLPFWTAEAEENFP